MRTSLSFSQRFTPLRRAMLPFVCGMLVAGVLAVPALTTAESRNKDDVYRQLGLFGDIFQRVRESYVDEVDDKKTDRGRNQWHADLA